MKKTTRNLFVILFLFFYTGTGVYAQRPVRLPGAVVNFLNTYFTAAVQITYYSRDNFDYSYNLELSNGFEADFYINGDWKYIDGGGTPVPNAIVESLPEDLIFYLNNNYAGHNVLRLSKDYKKQITVKMDTNDKIVFDKYGKFIKKLDK